MTGLTDTGRAALLVAYEDAQAALNRDLEHATELRAVTEKVLERIQQREEQIRHLHSDLGLAQP